MLGIMFKTLCASIVMAAALMPTAVSAEKHNPVDAASAHRFLPPDKSWVARTLQAMRLRDKVAQLIAVRVDGRFANTRSPEFAALSHEVVENHVGAVVLFAGNVYESAVLLNALQTRSRLPLLVAADFERGASFRIADTTPFPYQMAIGATGSEDYAYREGIATATEARALGVHWVYAPVVDVNNNPDNPVINIRSFGEDPETVARLGAAFIKGARANGVLTTAKHFPGHGDTATDSHIGLPVVASSRSRLDAVELVPFRRAIEAGVDSIMTAHVAVPEITGDAATPATLSSKVLTGLLRGELGFHGLVVTDAMEMGGITTRYWTGLAALRALQAGADMILLPTDTEVVLDEVIRAVRRGDINEGRIDQSVEKVLEAKSRLGLHRRRTVQIEAIAETVSRPEDRALAQDIADHSITVVKDERHILPLNPLRPPRILSLVLSSDADSAPGSVFQTEMRRRFAGIRTLAADPRITKEFLDSVSTGVASADIVVCATLVRVVTGKGNVALPDTQRAAFDRLIASGKPVIWVAFGNPYLLPLYPQVAAYACTFSYAEVSQVAAAKALSGAIPISGRMPVSIPGQCGIGAGLQIAPFEMRLQPAAPETKGLAKDAFVETQRVLYNCVQEKTFPGAALVVGYRGSMVFSAAAGRLSYEPSSPAVSADTLYDLASVSKVVATASAAMMLAESGRLILNAPVQEYIPEFQGPGKDKVTVEALLTHSAGLPAFAPFYKDTQGYEQILNRLYRTPLEYEPGTKSTYSDLGMILLGEVINRASGRTLDRFIGERLFEPLGLKNTLYRPPRALLPRIAPTEDDPWRKRVVHGEVHDENAYAMGGVAGHAGLFSTARDLAVFAQMLLNGGIYDHRRFFSSESIRRFTALHGRPEFERSLGWSKPSQSSWTGRIFSPAAYGHTGFTGTMIWIDPERELFIVLLTNRVHPSRSNTRIEEARQAVCEAVVRALSGPQ
jgi:beta-N-acetylhexosaminidase